MSIFKDIYGTKQDPLLQELSKKPKDEATHYYVPEIGWVHQADLLHLPRDEGNEYLLVVVDASSRKLDAEPLKNKQATTVLKAIKAIYKRKNIKQPHFIHVDSGSEFKGAFATWAKASGIFLKVGKVGRHRQQAFVENANKRIGHIIYKKINNDELLTGHASTGQWSKYIKSIVKVLNKTVIPPQVPKLKLSSKPIILLKEGTAVRVKLEQPETVAGTKLHGRFRASDIRFKPKTEKITGTVLDPFNPPMYYVGKDKNTVYTKGQLNVVQKRSPTTAKPSIPKRYQVEKLLKYDKDSDRYLVKWKGYKASDNTWESRKKLTKDVPRLVRAFKG